MSVVAFAHQAEPSATARRRATGLVALALAVAYLVASLISPASALAIPPPIAFADANLEAAVRTQLGIPSDPITQSDMDNLVTLDAHGSSISSLVGLEHAVNLTTLQIYDNSITDISPLVGTTSLSVLGIWNNQVADLTPLQSITSLHWMNAGNNDIVSLAPLSGLTNLQYLDVNNNQVSSLTPLSGLSSLSALMVYNNPAISDLSPLSGLTGLSTLYAGQNSITDITPLSGLANLESLSLGYQAIPDITPLSGLTNLTTLDLFDNGTLVDISALAPLTKLEWLNISRNHIYDISPLAGLGSVHPATIYLGWNWLDLTPGSETSQIVAGLTARGCVVNNSGQRSGGAITGLVVSPSGARLSGVTAALTNGPRAFTSAGGAFTIGLARPGDRTLTLSKPYFISRTVPLSVTEGTTHTVNATLVPAKIALTIRRSPSGSSLNYKRKRGIARYTLSTTLTDARGNVRGAWVWLQKSSNGKRWTTAYKIKTNSLGKAAVGFRAKTKRTVYYRWYAPATAYNYAYTTSKQRVRVK
jgi:internalin A